MTVADPEIIACFWKGWLCFFEKNFYSAYDWRLYRENTIRQGSSLYTDPRNALENVLNRIAPVTEQDIEHIMSICIDGVEE